MLSRLARKNLHTWLGGWAGSTARRWVDRVHQPRPGHRHLLFAVCDHYEPLWGKTTSHATGDARVAAWQRGYPALVKDFRDADGRPPRHSFFFPGEEYAPEFLDRLAELCAGGFGEVELHLHHDGDTADGLRHDIGDYLGKYARHGHVSRTGEAYRFAFIHGNWCLANARQDGRWCGVDEEVQLLHEAGCYADFTFPSAPDECQPNLVNQIYWPTGDLRRRRAYATGRAARVGETLDDRLLMITGPLALARRAGSLKPRIESAALSGDDPPDPARVRSWAAQQVTVRGRPEWVFVKVHSHGAPEKNAAALLGEPARRMHETLAAEFNDGERWSLHYVTAREMYNIAIAATQGESGDPGRFRDHVVPPPPVAGR